MAGRPSALPSFKAFKRLSVHSPRRMAARTTHEERTATERREAGIHVATLAKVEQVLPNIRLLRLRPGRLADDEEPVKARDGTGGRQPPLIAYLYSTVSSRPVARCTHPRYATGGWFHHNVGTSRPEDEGLSRACDPAVTS